MRSTPRRTYPDHVLDRVRTHLPPRLLDAFLAVAFTVLGQIELHSNADDGYQAGPLWLNVPLVALTTAPLATRSSFPLATLAVMVGAFAVPSVVVAHTLFFWGGLVPIAIATYTVSRRDDSLAARHAWAVGPIILLAGMLHVPELRLLTNIAFGVGLYAAVWGAGRVMRRLASQRAELADALAQLQVEQQARRDEAVLLERSRIAAEMHDVVAHAVSLMMLQVGAARMRLETDRTEVPDQLRAAETTGRAALDELRRTLGVLRRSDEPPRQPLPGLSVLGPLVDGFRDAGLEVEIDVDELVGLPASVELAVYRVVQEGLTNALKHAGAVPVQVAVTRRGDELLVEVRNAAGTGLSLPSGGHGLAGMRERVTLLGGRLDAGPSDDGFAVRACLPVSVEAAS
jgi:signal transduction histidine kinase